jgi:hypothetical protein
MIVRTIALRRIGMAVYNVVMGQGITVKNLGANMLITGIGDGADAVQSCSVVMFFNTKSCAAGLFHFPAGNVKKELGSKAALTAMSKAVSPNDCYIAYGVTNLVSVFAGPGATFSTTEVPTDPNHSDLREFVLGILPDGGRLRRMPAESRRASIRQEGNSAIIGSDLPTGAVTNLGKFAAGPQAGYTIYWKGK